MSVSDVKTNEGFHLRPDEGHELVAISTRAHRAVWARSKRQPGYASGGSSTTRQETAETSGTVTWASPGTY